MIQNTQPIRIQKGCCIHDGISPNLKPSCATLIQIVLPNVFSVAWHKLFMKHFLEVYYLQKNCIILISTKKCPKYLTEQYKIVSSSKAIPVISFLDGVNFSYETA